MNNSIIKLKITMLNLRHYFLQLQVGTEKNKGERDGGGGGGGEGVLISGRGVEISGLEIFRQNKNKKAICK